MDDITQETPMYSVESSTTTIVGVSNLAIRDSRLLPECEVMSYTVGIENVAPSRPLDKGAVRVGNSMLKARVRETAFLRDRSEDM